MDFREEAEAADRLVLCLFLLPDPDGLRTGICLCLYRSADRTGSGDREDLQYPPGHPRLAVTDQRADDRIRHHQHLTRHHRRIPLAGF